MEADDLYYFLKNITDKTSTIVKKHFRGNLLVEYKNDLSPVTLVDKIVEKTLIEAIQKEFEGHSIHGEETGKIIGTNEYEWVIDPIDGTKTFIHGVPLFGTLIALLRNKKPIIGVYHNPILGDLLIGDNKTCLYNGHSVKMRICPSIKNATLLTTDHFAVGKFQKQEGFDNLIKATKMYRTWGDAYGYFLLATGYADIMIDPIMSRWDSLALVPIIQGAGGVITSYNGQTPVDADSIIAAPENLIEEIISIINKS